MKEQKLKWKADTIRWRRFSRQGDAIFLSLHKEIAIGVLSAATLTFAVPDSVAAHTTMGHTTENPEGGIDLDDVEVIASRVSMPLEQTARIVSIITRQEIESCPAQSVADLLKYASGIDVRQRGAYGIQTDISIDGGTSDQIVILINGINISSAQTGHHSADFPFNTDDIERIEVLEGAASRVYGSSAYSGAINIVTRSRVQSRPYSAILSAAAGSWGTVQTGASVNQTSERLYNNLSAGFSRSDGGVSNSDHRRVNAFYSGGTTSDDADVKWQLGVSRKQYGANTFYSGKFPDQYEENLNHTVSISARTKGKVQVSPSIYWNRAYDHYQLIRGLSPTQENYHCTDVYGANVNAQTEWKAGTTAIGAEFRNEGILSTSLGEDLSPDKYIDVHGTDRQYTRHDNRTNVCYFLEHGIVLNRFTLNVGLMANLNTWLDHRFRFYPGIDISYRPMEHLTLYAAWNMAQRIPTFTDIYYKNPAQVGYAGLQPERTSEFSIGGKWQSRNVTASLRIYHRHQTNMIDWVVPTDSVVKYGRGNYATYHATNLMVNNFGVSVSTRLTTNDRRHSLALQYTYIKQNRHDDIQFDDSYYGLNYLRHKLTATATSNIWKGLSASLSLRFQDRMGTYYEYDTTHTLQNDYGWNTYSFLQKSSYVPFALLDLHVEWKARRYELYADLNNLTNYEYIDIGNIRQPGFWFTGGVKINL